MLSKDKRIDPNDVYLGYVTVREELSTGQVIEDNDLQFNLPENTADGQYYLAVLVDDQQIVEESNENDNASFDNKTLTVQNSLPDITIDTWFAGLTSDQSFGYFTYRISNTGVGDLPAGWDINLVLSTSRQPTAENSYYLYYETMSYITPSSYVYGRTVDNPAYFSLDRDSLGNQFSDGIYYLSMWVDDTQKIEESNELNNVSVGPLQSVSSGRLARGTENQTRFSMNGKHIPSKETLMKKVELLTLPSGRRTLRELKMTDSKPMPHSADYDSRSKVAGASDPILFPTKEIILMPQTSKKLLKGK